MVQVLQDRQVLRDKQWYHSIMLRYNPQVDAGEIVIAVNSNPESAPAKSTMPKRPPLFPAISATEKTPADEHELHRQRIVQWSIFGRLQSCIA